MLLSSFDPSNPNQSITLTATITSGITTEPTGTVTFVDGTVAIGTSSLNGRGVATFSTSNLSLGTHELTAVYSGDGNFAGSTSVVLSQLVQQGSTNTTLNSSANPSALDRSITLTATVSSGGATVPTGSVKFEDGNATLGTSSLNGVAAAYLSIAILAAGTHSITAVYSGDTNYAPATSSVLSQIVQRANSSVSLSMTPAAANLNQSVAFSVNVTPAVAGTPTGTIALLDGSNQIGTSALSGSGAATFFVATLSAGSHVISATYSGDSNFNSSASTAAILMVTAPDFSLAAAPAALSVASGNSAQSNITINPLGGLNPSGVTLTCSISPSPNPAPSCTIGPVSMVNDTGTATLNISTVGIQANLRMPPKKNHSGAFLGFALLFPAILLSGGGLNKSIRRKLFGLLLLSGCLLQIGCGATGQTNQASKNSLTTPPGTYTVTIKGAASANLQHSTSISLTVQ